MDDVISIFAQIRRYGGSLYLFLACPFFAMTAEAESLSENVGQASSLPVQGASSPRVPGGRMPPEPADKMSAPHFQTGSKSKAGSLFSEKVAPALSRICLECHGGKTTKGGFDLSTREGFLKGGDAGPAVDLSNSSGSLLLKLLKHEAKPYMPHKKERLPPGLVDDLAAWINQGAVYDFPLSVPATPSKVELWSARRLGPVTVPKANDQAWVRTPVDQFILQKLEAANLRPTPPASKEKLLRRLYFDLIGLPPSLAERESFLRDDSPGAYHALADKLLDDPRHGERWARHWLDLARYAESNGYEKDHNRTNAYHYRDFVIKALNMDMPYDQFVQWQLAGDEYDSTDPLAMAATGFCASGPLESFQRDEKNRSIELDDILATTGSAMLGLSIACARCHDHKHDPFSQKDYYGLLAAFATGAAKEVIITEKSSRDAFQKQDAEYRKIKGDLERWLFKQHARHEVSSSEALRKKLTAEERQHWTTQSQKQEVLEKNIQRISSRALIFTDGRSTPTNCFLLEQGDWARKKEKVDLAFPAALRSAEASADRWLKPPPPDAKTTWQRRAFAEWITDQENGAGHLLARVIVNRLWQHHFGQGLVKTPNDFGTQGEPPSHPELLDWLAHELIRSGWRLKTIHRLIVRSAAYQQDAAGDARGATVDPDNSLLWRRETRRLESEALRDSMLAVSGVLNSTMFGPAVFPRIQPEAIATGSTPKWPTNTVDGPNTWRRSIYVFAKRSLSLPFLEAFDSPDASASCGRRFRTTTPAQALELWHGDFAIDQARRFALRLKSAGGSLEDKIRLAWILAFSRDAQPREVSRAAEFCAKQERRARFQNPAELEALRQLAQCAPEDVYSFAALSDLCQVLFNSNEFIYVD
jgi:hypothetical protein